jgi:hypothetical protein
MTITINLLPSERNALKVLARQERREMRAQAAMLIRNELTRRGLLYTTDARANAPNGVAAERDARGGQGEVRPHANA